MGIGVKYGGEAVMQWEGEGSKKSSVGLELGRKGRDKEGRGRRLEWKGRVEGKNYSIIIIIIRKRRERD